MKNKKGFFIVLDGIDGAGKTTQTELLVDKLRKKGYETETIDFPRYYDNFFGKVTGEYLNGDFGKIDPKLASILYALDRWESRDFIKEKLKKGNIVVCNRYMSANMIHQGGRLEDPKKRRELLKWLEEMEFGIFGISKPDLVLYLDVIPEIGQKLVDKKTDRLYNKGKKRDIHESDKNHLLNARKNALRLVKQNQNWRKINCMKNKKILAPEIISEIIYKEVYKEIKNKINM